MAGDGGNSSGISGSDGSGDGTALKGNKVGAPGGYVRLWVQYGANLSSLSL